MDITREQEISERNDERMVMTENIRDWRAHELSESEIIEKIKAHIFDLRAIVWKTKSREQECYALLQENEHFRKHETSLATLAYESKQTQDFKVTSQASKIESIVDKAIENFKKIGLSDKVIADLIAAMKPADKEKTPESFWCRECGHTLPYLESTKNHLPLCIGNLKSHVAQKMEIAYK
mgnify:CR=1 FL=1